MKNIIFIASPGAGKGTQSKLISQEYNIPHISTGDLLRDERNSNSILGQQLKVEMDKGNLISDDIIVKLLRERVSKVDCNNGYILDGYPRTVEQAIIYNDLLKELQKDIGKVIYMDIDKELALTRTQSRLICSSCGRAYNTNVEEVKPKIAGICDVCGHSLRLRNDDTEATFLTRYNTFMYETSPLIEYYTKKGVLNTIKVETSDSVQDVFNKIKKIID